MFRKLAAAGATAAVIIGAGTTALAVSGTPDTTAGYAAAPTAPTTHGGKGGHGAHGAHGARKALRKALRHVAHGAVVTKGKDGTFVEHDGILGQVTSVSATALTVRSADGFTKTFVINSATHVRKRPGAASSSGHAKGAPAKISDVHTGDQVGVLGEKPESATSNPTAKLVIDGLPKK